MKEGTVVVSLSGHDKGKLYIVTGTKDKKILLCDGKSKRLDCPKSKNKKHLKEIGKVDLSSYNPLYDAHIEKELKRIKNVDMIVYKK